MQKTISNYLEKFAEILLYCGGVVVLIQATWITYGVIMRYVFDNPDGMVTEATALMLVPVAFFGLGYALCKDAYPKVTMLRDIMPRGLGAIVDRINLLVMVLIGLFFSTSAVEAMIRSFHSGSASEILLWPRFYFWIPVSISLVVFTLLAIARLVSYEAPSETPTEESSGSNLTEQEAN
jgi:TRAP-type C4-dicarboxylate transport system permease small subunit